MADKTTQSIANNLIDPTNYVQGGGVVDGKLGFENIPEDWVMYVQLFVKPHSRSMLMKSDDGKIIATDDQEYLVAEIPYYKRNINKNTSGSIIPYDIQTTEYTDIFGAKGLPLIEDGRTPNTLGQESAFGMTSINIDFNDIRQPSIDITFVDIRGAGLASYGPTGGVSKSPYSWFFLLPYPEFCLKVKGFYGKTVSIPCLIHKFDMAYNNATGNFDITTSFVGYPFSVLNDINIKILERMCCIPGGPEELENVYNKLRNCLDKNNPDDLLILQEMPRIEDLCIKEYIRAIESGKIDNPVQRQYSIATQSGDELINKYNTLIKETNLILSTVRANGGNNHHALFENFKSYLIQCHQLEEEFQLICEKSSDSYANNTTKSPGLGRDNNKDKQVLKNKADQTVVFQIENFSDYIKNKSIPLIKFNRITLESSSSYFDPCAGNAKTDGGNPTAELTFKNGINSVLSNTSSDIKAIKSVIDSFITKKTFTNAMNSGASMNAVEKTLLMLREQFQERLKYLENYQIYLCNYFQTIEKKVQKEFTETLRVRPSLQRIVTLLAINVEAFLNLLLKVSIKAEKYHEANKERAIYTNYFTDASNQQFENFKGSTNNTSSSLRGVKLYAWPKTYKKDEKGKKVEVFPEEINPEFSEWPEVRFTKHIIDAIASNNCNHRKLIKATDNGVGKWLSLNLFEDAPFTINKQLNQINPLDSPYNNSLLSRYISSDKNSNTSGGVKEDKLKQLIVSRALINLTYFNRLWEQDSDVAEGNLLMYDGYVKSLAERDANNLITTLSDCNLIENLAQNFAGDAGVALLNAYVKTGMPFNFAGGLTFKSPPNLDLPYASIFYLGNNNINSIVDDGTTAYQRQRTISEPYSQLITDNYFGLSFYDKPQYPFYRYITVYIDDPIIGETIISGFEYDNNYKTNVLNISSTQDVIYNYCPWSSSIMSISPPLGIPISTISHPELSRNIYYNKTSLVKFVTYETFLNPSCIRDLKTFNIISRSKFTSEQVYTFAPISPKTLKYELGNGIPSWGSLFNLTTPKPTLLTDGTTTSAYNQFTIGYKGFQTYKLISLTDKRDDALFENSYHPINLYESDKTYYWGADPLIISLNNTIRTYHTTYNHYLSDVLKSYLWDPYKTKIGNPAMKLGNQEKSAYNIANNLNKTELREFAITNTSDGKIYTVVPPGNTPFNIEWQAGSNWGSDEAGNRNLGFQNMIFYGTNKNIPHRNLNNKLLPILSYKQDNQTNQNLSLIQYLFNNDSGPNTNKQIPEGSIWISQFGTDKPIGFNYDGNTFTLKDIFGEIVFDKTNKYFLSYQNLTSDASKGLSTHSFYEIPVDMNSTWFRAKMREFNKNITPVKKYQTTYMKKLSYLIWKEATMRILSMCDLNLSNGKTGINGGQYYTDNYLEYANVYLVDDPSKRSGGPTTATTSNLFIDTYPQSKFYNRNIDFYDNNTNYKFYSFNSDGTGTYKIGTNSSETFDGTITPGPVSVDAFYPNDNPTDNFVPGIGVTTTQPPLITRQLSDYYGSITETPKWTRLFIHQTEWWKNLTTNPALSSGGTINEVRAMKTYLTLMSLWGGNSMDALVYNYPLISPSAGLFRVNNLDLVTLGGFLWGSQGVLHDGSTLVASIILGNADFNCGVVNNTTLQLKLGDITKAFPFDVIFRDSHPTQSLDRYFDYGIICRPSTNITNKFGRTVLTPSVTLGNDQIWRVDWDLKSVGATQYSITPAGLPNDVKRDLINHFLQFVETSEFSRNIDNNLLSLSMLREVAEIALSTVEENYQNENDYLKFPFDIEQTLLMWADWASIVDLNQTTKDFKSYFDNDDGWRVKRSEQKTILSSKLFDTLTKEIDNNGQLDNPFKIIKTHTINTDTYYYSPTIRVNDNLLMLKGDIGKKIITKLLKVITYDEQQTSQIPIIIKRDQKYETILTYKQKGYGKTTSGNDQNYFFEHLFKGFYFPTIHGGMKTTDSIEYDSNSLGSNKLFFSKSWLNSGAFSIEGERLIDAVAGKSNRLQTYFKTFCNIVGGIKTNNGNYERCKKGNQKEQSQDVDVDIKGDSLAMYRTLKNLFSRWLAGATEDDHTYKRSGCNSIVNAQDKCKSLIQNIFIVDRINRPAGNMVCVNQKHFASLFNESPKISAMTFLSNLVSSDEGGIGGFLIEYPTFFNFGNSGINLEPNPGQAMWGMTTNVDEKYAGPAIVIYVQKADTSAANAIVNDYVNEDINSYKNADPYGGVSVLPEDFNTPDSRGVIFKVAIGNENNNIFTNLQINTQEFKETYEHISVLGQIAQEANTGTPKFLGQNLYNLWNVRSFTASLECFGNMLIQPGMFFYLENVPIFGGTYIIKKVSHTIEPHMIKTKFWGSRVNNIPYPYVNKNAVGSYYQCNNYTLEERPDTIHNDPGYCKERMLDILAGFVEEIQKTLGVAPIVYTSDEFLSSLGFTEEDSQKFYEQYDVMTSKVGEDKPFNNVKSISITQEEYTDDYVEENFSKPVPQSDIDAANQSGGFVVTSTGWAIPTTGYANPIGKHHPYTAIDITPKEGNTVTEIKCSMDGVVRYIHHPIINRDGVEKDGNGCGNYVEIVHTLPNGEKYMSRYLHLRKGNPYASTLPAIGHPIAQGTVIGYMGSTGHSTGTHLHFEIRKVGHPYGPCVNPREFIPAYNVTKRTLVEG